MDSIRGGPRHRADDTPDQRRAQQRVERSAARLRIVLDKELGRTTPGFVFRIAGPQPTGNRGGR
ncbi:hypothetical protein [Arthrobacter sp. KK5.5]|uniref:hypothetical protein n=1 Tax=Arthrobacter sp. KK5.5 TaxID=3373084 RepID=UPI003EE4D63C